MPTERNNDIILLVWKLEGIIQSMEKETNRCRADQEEKFKEIKEDIAKLKLEIWETEKNNKKLYQKFYIAFFVIFIILIIIGYENPMIIEIIKRFLADNNIIWYI